MSSNKSCETKKMNTPLEMAVIIAHSDKTLDEKHAAWHELMLEYKYQSESITYRFFDNNECNLFNQLDNVIKYNELYTKIFMTPEEGAVYECTLENDIDCVGLHCIFSTFDEALAVRLKDVTREEIKEWDVTIEMYKMKPGHEGYLWAEIDYDGNILEILPYGDTHGWDDDLSDRPVCIGDMFSLKSNNDGTVKLENADEGRREAFI